EDYLSTSCKEANSKVILKSPIRKTGMCADLVREHIGLKILSWKKVDKESRDKLWDKIRRYFDIGLDSQETWNLESHDGTDDMTVVFGMEKEVMQRSGNELQTEEYDHIPPEEKCMALLLAEERFLKIKQVMEEEQNQPEVMQELLLKLIKDLQIFKGIQSKQVEQEEPTAQNFLINLNFPMADDDEYTGISEDICDVPSCDYFDAECGLINSLLSRDSSITSPKIDFLPEEFVGELDFIDPILPGIDEDDFDEDDFDEDDFDEEEGENDNDILQIEDEILREKLLNVNLLVDKIEALKLTPFIPFVLENPSSSPIPVMDSDFLVEEVDTFLVSEDSIPPGGGEIDVFQNVKNDDSFTFVIRTFLPFLTYPVDSPLLLSTGSEDTILDSDIFT
ncbi:hypothetical protein Tco_1066396, partial [Tanacetum coccineum]